jgi:aspartyl-tRNA synthetase
MWAPHGGKTPGLDRLLILIAGANNRREVTALP